MSLPNFDNTPIVGRFRAKFASWNAVKRPSFDDPLIQVDAIQFEFFIAEKDRTLSKTCNLSFGKRASLPQLVREMSGQGFDERVLQTSRTLEAHLDSLLNREYELKCVLSESGKSTVIKDVDPVPFDGSAVKPRPVDVGEKHPAQASIPTRANYADDDIPF